MTEAPRVGDLVAGAVTVAFGAGAVLYARRFPELEDGAPGPALFPSVVGGLLTLFGVVLAARWVTARIRARPGSTEPAASTDGPRPGWGLSATASAETTPDTQSVEDADTAADAGPRAASRIPARAWLDAALVVGSVVFYILVADLLGFAPTMAVLLFVLTWRLGAKLPVAIGTAIMVPALIYLVFQRVLLVPLPGGLLG